MKTLKYHQVDITDNTPLPSVEFSQVVSCGWDIDVHQNLIMSTINHGNNQFETKHFNAYTRTLTELREWCKSEGVTNIGMDSTSIYYVPVFSILQDDFEIVLVNSLHVKGVLGHKKDKKDSIWLSKLPISDLLMSSFTTQSHAFIFTTNKKEVDSLLKSLR